MNDIRDCGACVGSEYMRSGGRRAAGSVRSCVHAGVFSGSPLLYYFATQTHKQTHTHTIYMSGVYHRPGRAISTAMYTRLSTSSSQHRCRRARDFTCCVCVCVCIISEPLFVYNQAHHACIITTHTFRARTQWYYSHTSVRPEDGGVFLSLPFPVVPVVTSPPLRTRI